MTLIRFAPLLTLGLVCTSLPISATARDIDNPLIGSWTWQPGGTCTEVYNWRADGTGHVTSGKEITETRFKISATPDDKGFYIFIDQILKDNRGKDCAGSTKDNTGEKSTFYVQIDPTGEMIRICPKPSEDACFGPLTRVPVVEI